MERRFQNPSGEGCRYPQQRQGRTTPRSMCKFSLNLDCLTKYPSTQVKRLRDKIGAGITEEVRSAAYRYMRDVLTGPIDPADAKDFDDALSFRRLSNGHIIMRSGVHIADVTHYVHPDTDYRPRGAKRYHFSLSGLTVSCRCCLITCCNGICSLRPNEDKLAFSVIFHMDDDGKGAYIEKLPVP